MRKHPFYSCDSCEDGSSTKNQILKGARGQAGATGKQGAAGVAGKGSLVVGSMFSNAGPTAAETDGADELLISDTLAILKSSGLDVDEVITIRPTLDDSDISHIKTRIRFSNGLFNWIAKWLIPRTVFAADAIGKVLVSTGTQAGQFAWQALSASFFDKYKVASTSTVSHGIGTKTFIVGSDLAWTPGVVARATSPIGYIEGIVLSYLSGQLVINVDRFSGTGSSSEWVINIGSREPIPSAVGGKGMVVSSNGSAYYLTPMFFAGEARAFFGVTIPDGWLVANGALLDRALYPELVTALGAADPSSQFYYGADLTKFRMPDAAGRALVGLDASTLFDPVGSKHGSLIVQDGATEEIPSWIVCRWIIKT